MSLVTAQALIEAEIRALTPEYLGHPFVEAPRSRPIEELPATNEQRLFAVRLGLPTRLGDFDGESLEVWAELSIKVRYRMLPGADDADRDLATMIAVDAHQLVRLMMRPNAPETWAGTIENVILTGQPTVEPVETDEASKILELRFELLAFDGA